METVISKSYGGAQSRLVLPKSKDVAGVTGDNCSTRLCFKIPKAYATGWTKYIEFDCTVERDGVGEIIPSYLLDENDSFLIPFEIASIGGEVKYNLKLVSDDGSITEKSEQSVLYFRNSATGTDTEPEDHVDIITVLVNNAYCTVSYADGTSEGTSETRLPVLTFTPIGPAGIADTVTLNVPYLDSNGHILNRFIDKEIVVEIFHVSSPNALTSLTQAQIPDMALIDQSASTETYYMDLYMLVGADPTVATNWYLVHTDNPTFGSVSATSADFNNTTTVGLSVTGDETVSGNVSVTGQVSTAQVDTPKINGTGTSPNAPLEITGNTTVKNGLTVQGTLASKSITDNGESVSIIKDISATGSDVSVRNQTVSGKTTTGTLESGAATFTGNIDASNKTVTASTFIGDVTGNLTGNVTGDLTGDVTGNVVGNVTGDLTGNVTGNVVGDVTGDVTGNLTGNVTGNLTGNVTGDVTGDLTGNASTATKWQTTRKINLSGVTATEQNIDGSGNVTIPVTAVPSSLLSGEISNAIIPSHADSSNKYGVGSTSQYGHVKVDATMSADSANPVQNSTIVSFVNSSIGTATANFLGTYDAHDDLGLTVVDSTNPTNQQIATALATYLANHSVVPTNNDYAFVSVNYPSTVDVDEYRRFKFNGTQWEYEYTLNNSSFTQAQWNTINSLITNTTSNPHVGVDVKDINDHLGNSNIHVPPSSDDTNTKVLVNTKNDAPTWQTVSAGNPTLVWGTENEIGTIAGQTFKVTMPANPNIDAKTTSSQLADTKLYLVGAQTQSSSGQTTYSNNKVYVGTDNRLYSNDSQVVNLADTQTISGIKTFSAVPVFQSFITIADTGLATNTSLPSSTRTIATYFRANDGSSTGLIGNFTQASGNRVTYLATQGTDGNTINRLDLWHLANNTSYVTAPFRAYADAITTAGASDVITKAHLESAITIGGAKTFTSDLTLSNTAIVKTTSSNAAETPTSAKYIPVVSVKGADNQNYGFIRYFCSANSQDRSLQLELHKYTAGGSTTSEGAYLQLVSTSSGTAYGTVTSRSYASAGNNEILVKAHVPDLISANVGNGQISLTSSRGTAIDSFTVNQSAGKNIVLPAGSTQYTDESMTFALQSTPDFSDYPYMASKSITGLTADMYATVTFDDSQVSSGQYAPFCQTLAGEIRLYAKSNVGAITVPTISVGMDDSSAQQSMSNFVTLTGDQSIGDIKSHTSEIRRIVSPGTTQFSYNVMRGYDTNNTRLWEICSTSRPDGTTRLYVNARQSDATFKEVVLSDGQHTSYSSSNTNDVVTIGSLQASTDVVHRSGDETILGKKTHSEGIFGNWLVHNVSANDTNYVKVSYKANTTQFAKIKLCSYINNTSTAYFDILLAWNGGSARKLFVRRLGASNIPISNFKMAYDGTNLIMFFECVPYHTVFVDVENAFSWTNTMSTTVEYLTNPDLSGYTLENATEV